MVLTEVFTYNQKIVKFDLRGQNLMINATHMAKIFKKQPSDFLRLEQTESFIEEAIKDENFQHFFSFGTGISPSEDRKLELYRTISTGRNNGTWMHRILALKFAAWLSPAFELWVFRTIDDLLFKHARQLSANIQDTVERRKEIEKIKDELLTDERFMRLEQLLLEDRKAKYVRGKVAKEQMDFYKSLDSSD
jgi:hypothetical protein